MYTCNGWGMTFFHFIALFSFFSYKLQYVLETKEHCVRDKNKSKRTKSTDFSREVYLQLWRITKHVEKGESLIIGSRLRERDKKNEEYYVGDYSHSKNLKSKNRCKKINLLFRWLWCHGWIWKLEWSDWNASEERSWLEHWRRLNYLC